MDEEKRDEEQLEPLEEMVQTEEDLKLHRQELIAEAPWNGLRISKGQANWMMILQAIAFLAVAMLGRSTGRPAFEISLINEILIILLPGILFVWMTRRPFKKVYRLNPLSGKMVALIVGMSVAIYPLTVLINALVMIILSQFMELSQPALSTGGTLQGYLLSIIFVCLVPGICEEMMFRGVMLHAYEVDGSRKAIWMTALLFAVFHFSLENFIGPFILGVYFGYLVVGTGSIYAGIIAHMVHNFISNTLIYLMELSHVVEVDTEVLPSVDMIAAKDLMIGFMAISFFVLLGLIIFIKLSRVLYDMVKRRKRRHKGLISEEAKIETNQEFLDPGEGNIFEQVPIWWMGLLFVINNAVNILMN